ncbi:glycosyltransferase family 2 protein [Microbacterium sp. ASV49]|uniref:Glycosyltransferase family 2 protein n=1 Tax=Microbacterium candidum TaxID=3041922 RepID=A0ABT7N299_9MICO|nr:glycosyltransferase family 2 protein [Microbacterium sp. ASV49]MDL9980828.1 glycosyltransferase family 2 protein [Microbacterium sp. ASV49]
MSRPVVTVIVPGRDVADFAAEAVDSLRAQTFEDWRAILVDDGSEDATGAIFDAAAAADDRLTVIRHEASRGLGAARNAALEMVDTPYVGFLDADDVLRPRALERLVETITATGSDLVVGAYVRLRPDGSGGYAPGEVQPWVTASTDPERHGVTLADHPSAAGNIVAWSKLSRSALWDGLRFPEGRAYEDQVVAQLLYTRARGFDVIPDVVVEWRERANGTSITQRKAELPVLRDYLDALSGGIAVLDAQGLDAAAAGRVALIFLLDLPPLIEIARIHPDPAYRTLLASFVEELAARPGAPRTPPPL